MINRLHIAILLILAMMVWALTLYVLKIPLSAQYLKPYTIALGVLTAVATVFERWLWKFWIFKGWLVKRPNIQGTWKVNLISNYVDPKTKKKIRPIVAVVVVRQTLVTLSMRLYTEESSSYIVGHKILFQNDGFFELVSVYQNEPAIHLRGSKSEIHYGAFKLAINGDPVSSLSGHYWTDRGTAGTIELENRKEKLVSTFQEGKELLEIA